MAQPTEPPKLGFYVYFLACMAVIGGFFFGYDCGIMSGAMLYLPDYDGMKPMTAIWKQVLVSVTPGTMFLELLFMDKISVKITINIQLL